MRWAPPLGFVTHTLTQVFIHISSADQSQSATTRVGRRGRYILDGALHRGLCPVRVHRPGRHHRPGVFPHRLLHPARGDLCHVAGAHHLRPDKRDLRVLRQLHVWRLWDCAGYSTAAILLGKYLRHNIHAHTVSVACKVLSWLWPIIQNIMVLYTFY